MSSLDWVAATAASPASVVVAALAADHVGIGMTYVVAGALAAATSAVGLLMLGRTGEPTGRGPDHQALTEHEMSATCQGPPGRAGR